MATHYELVLESRTLVPRSGVVAETAIFEISGEQPYGAN